MRKGKGMSCRPEDGLEIALARMEQARMAVLPVVDDGGFLVGMVERSAAQARTHGKRTVESAMKRKVFCCRADDTLSDVEASLREQKVESIPVIDDCGTLQGIVNLSDLPWATRKSPVPSTLELSDSAVFRMQTAG